MVVILTDLQDFCQEPRSMNELENGGFERAKVYAAVKRGDLKNSNAVDAWGRKQRGKGLFVSTVTPIAYNATLLVQAWSTPQPQGDIHV